MPTFDGINLFITLDSGVTNLDWIDIYSDWKDWLLSSPLNRGYPPAFRTTGGDSLNALLNSGSYWFLMNDYGWRMRPPEEDITIYVSGNLAPNDADLPVFVSTIGGYTTAILGLQPVTQGFSPALGRGVEHGLFNNAITLDVENGTEGTGYDQYGDPIGTLKTPSNNLTHTMVIAEIRGIGTVFVVGDAIVDSGGDYSDIVWIGESHEKTIINVSAASNVNRGEFYSAKVEGTLDADALLHDCMIEDLTYVNGEIKNCILKPPGVMELGGSSQATLVRCVTECTAGGPPYTIDMGSVTPMAIRDLSGKVKLINKSGTQESSAVLSGGAVVIDLATMINGRLKIAGVGDVVDTSGNSLPIGVTWYGDFELWNNAVSNNSITTSIWNAELIEYALVNTMGYEALLNSYDGKVCVKSTGTDGPGYPYGTEGEPVKTIAGALVIAALYDIDTLRIEESITIDGGENISGFTLIADRSLGNSVNVTNAITQGTYFQDLTVQGVMSGSVRYTTCVLGAITNFDGGAKNCLLTDDVTVTGTGANYHSAYPGFAGCKRAGRSC